MSGGLDPLIHPPARLQIMGLLGKVSEMEFGRLRSLLEISDSVLSKHLAALTEAGYVVLRKAALEGRQRTWVASTGNGRKAFKSHLGVLQQLAAAAE